MLVASAKFYKHTDLASHETNYSALLKHPICISYNTGMSALPDMYA